MNLSVCIFACNEERTLPKCIGALDAAGLSASDSVHIMVNGCTDDTPLVAKTLAEADQRITAHDLPVGDKSNAWNEYVHRIADDALRTHVFIDGDVWPSVKAMTELAEALQRTPAAYAAAALPASGRSRRGWAYRLLENNYLSGNLYALSAVGLKTFRQHNIRLPLGAKGEDGLITYLLLTDMRGGEDDTHRHRIVVADKATFEFRSLGPNLRDWQTYRQRLIRYSARHFQKQILYRLLKKHGVAAMPESTRELYTPEALKTLHPRLDPVNFWFDLKTLRDLRGAGDRQRAQVI